MFSKPLLSWLQANLVHTAAIKVSIIMTQRFSLPPPPRHKRHHQAVPYTHSKHHDPNAIVHFTTPTPSLLYLDGDLFAGHERCFGSSDGDVGS